MSDLSLLWRAGSPGSAPIHCCSGALPKMRSPTRMSDTMLFSKQHRKNLSLAHLGKHHTEETRQKIRAAMQRRVLSKAHRQRISASRMGSTNTLGKTWHWSTQAKRKLSKQLAGRPFPIAATRAFSKKAESAAERRVQRCLQTFGVHYHKHKPLLNRFVADIYLPKAKVDIEVDGSYWHSRPEWKARDRKRDAQIRSSGIRVVRISESRINEDIKKAVRAALKQVGL